MPYFRAGEFGDGLAKFGEALNAKLEDVDRPPPVRFSSHGNAAATQLASTSSGDNFAIGKTLDRTQPSVLAAVVGASWVATAIRSQQPVCKQCGKRSGVRFVHANQTALLADSSTAGLVLGSDATTVLESSSTSSNNSSDASKIGCNVKKQSRSLTMRNRRVPWEISRFSTWDLTGERWKAYHCSKCGYEGRHVEFIPSGQMEQSARLAAAAAAAEARRRRAHSDRRGGSGGGGGSTPGGSSSGGGGGASW